MFKSLRTVNRPTLYPMGTSLDRVFDEFFENSFKEIGTNKYPMTDIYVEDGVTHIEVAVTGFSEKDINITLDNGVLNIEGSKEIDTENRKYHTRNIAKRSFKRQFQLAETVEDIKANIENGVLHLELIEVQKEDTKKIININTTKDKEK